MKFLELLDQAIAMVPVYRQIIFRTIMITLALYMPSEPHGEGDIAVELWKKLEPGEK